MNIPSTNIIGMKTLILLSFFILLASCCEPHCSDCSNNFCTACASGYQLSIDSQCIEGNVTGCSLYDEVGNCYDCQPTFILMSPICEKQYDGCIQRQIDQTCSLCAFGKTLINQNCIGILNCAEGTANCTRCRDNFTLQNGVCVDESAGCMLADPQSGVCIMCNTGYELVGYQCVNQTIKPKNCYIYDSNGNCFSCKVGYILNAIQRCVIPGNSICKYFDENHNCLACTNSKLSIVNGSCIDIYCKIGAPGNCQTCQAGFTVKNSSVCQLVDPNCQTFSQGSTYRCDACKLGYYIAYNGICTKLPVNCAAANVMSGACIQCMAGYTLKTTNFISQCKLPLQISNCQQIDQTTSSCVLCYTGYYVSNKVCAKVSSLCLGYDPQLGSCLNCKAGYLNYGGKCLDPNCAQTVNDICTQCKANFSPDPLSGLCRFTDPNCASLTFLGCNVCKFGYYLNPIVCTPYPPFCNELSSDFSTCLTCKTGWSLINGQCVVPVTNCLSYTYNGSLTFCTSCVENYQLSNFVCVYSGPIDKNCIAFNNSLCIRCSNRYYLINQTCIPVNPNCKGYSSDGNCTTCYSGYRVLNGNCIVDSIQTSSNCKVTINGTCVSCYSGYYVDSNTKNCVVISALCKLSNSTTGICLSCYNGYTLVSGVCIATSKDPNCIQFDLNGQCQVCSSRFFMKGTSCAPINPLCKTYNTTLGNCLSCYPGYYLTNGTCKEGASPSNDVNCKLSDVNGKCLQCYSSYYLSYNATCLLANPLCKTINFPSGVCLTCYNGYIIQSGNCVVSTSNNSDPNCIAYSNGVCTECYTGFFVKGDICTRINVLCKTYNSVNGQCKSCYPGYSLQSGKCIIPQSYTLSVQDPYCIQRSGSSCTMCSSGYFPLSGVCQTVNPLCKTVNQGGSCTSCYLGYTIQDGNCVVVQTVSIPFCQIIINDVCKKCIQGYYTRTPLQCTAVSILCSTYDQNSGYCSSCITGYFLQAGQCIYPAMGFDPNCMSYDISAYCNGCRPGYYLLNYMCTRIDPFCTNFNSATQTCITCGTGKNPSGAQCV